METKNNPIELVDLKFSDDDWRVTGYATVFESVDKVGDRIMKNAFDGWLEKDQRPSMHLEHLRWITPGKWDMVFPDEKGLMVDGHLTRGHTVATDLRASMRHGTIEGLSQGFIAVETEKNSHGGRDIHKIDLVEVSFTASPAEPKATIQSFKSEIESITSLKDAEAFLRESGMWSRSMACAYLGQIKSLLQSESDSSADQKRALQELSKALETHSLTKLLRKQK